MMRKWSLSLVAAAGVAALSIGTLHAQGGPAGPPGAKEASRVTAGSYKTDAGHSLIAWRVNHFGFNDYIGLFGDVEGTLTLDPANLSAAKVDVTIPIAKVTTPSAGLTGHLLRAGQNGGKPDFFGPEPAAARFVSTSVAVDGDDAKITGDLTLNGVTKSVVIDAEFSGAGKNPFNQRETVGFEGETTIKRSDFGLSGFLPMVGDEVELEITVAFEKQ